MTAVLVSMFSKVTARVNKPVAVDTVLDDIRGGKWQEEIEEVRAVLASKGKDAANERKVALLPAITFSGKFNGPHKAEALVEYSGKTCFDFDNLDDVDEAWKKLAGDPYCRGLFHSPCHGLKFLMETNSSAAEHGRAFDAAAAYFLKTYGLKVDPSGKDVCRLCFVSYDPLLVHNPDAAIFEISPAPKSKPRPKPAQRFDDTPDRAKVEDALKYILPDCHYKEWLDIGMALHSWSPVEGRIIWDSWSQKAKDGRYQQGLTDKKWETFHPGGITIRTLFKVAIDAGWKPARTERTSEKAEEEKEAGPKAATPEQEPWEKPIGFDVPVNLADFPVDVLPKPFNSFVADVSASKQVPTALTGPLVLGAAALAVAKRFRVYIGQSHNEPLNLFFLALMEPGSRKSDTFRACLAPVESFEIELAQNAKPEIARAQERRAIEEARLTEIRKRAGRENDPAKRQAMTIEAETLGANLTEIPIPPRMIAGDISPEHLASLLCANGGRMAVADAEGGLIFEIMAGRYTKNGGPNIEIFLKGHAGDAVRVDRSGRPADFTRSAALTCILTAQPAILRNLAAKDQLRDRGLLARFLFTMPSGFIGSRAYANKPMNAPLVEQYAAHLSALLAILPLDLNDPEAHRRINLDGDALKIWSTYYDQIEKAQAPYGELSHMTDFASKLPGAVARIAGILHLMKHGPQAPQNIEPDIVAGAWALGMFFLEHTKAAFAEMGAGGDMGLARRVYGWISRNRPERFTLGMLFNDLRRGTGLDLSNKLLPAMAILEDRNIIRCEPPPPSDKPGRKSFGSWEVNPAIVSGEII